MKIKKSDLLKLNESLKKWIRLTEGQFKQRWDFPSLGATAREINRDEEKKHLDNLKKSGYSEEVSEIYEKGYSDKSCERITEIANEILKKESKGGGVLTANIFGEYVPNPRLFKSFITELFIPDGFTKIGMMFFDNSWKNLKKVSIPSNIKGQLPRNPKVEIEKR